MPISRNTIITKNGCHQILYAEIQCVQNKKVRTKGEVPSSKRKDADIPRNLLVRKHHARPIRRMVVLARDSRRALCVSNEDTDDGALCHSKLGYAFPRKTRPIRCSHEAISLVI